MSETIFALASAMGRAGVSVIRVSGPDSWVSLHALSGQTPIVRMSHLYTLRDNVSRETIDQALVIAFKNPHSYTGEDVVEYHTHGSPAVVSSLLNALSKFENHRMAEPGEFTRRAFEHGKMDLTEAEAVADLIDAETQLQKNQALEQLSGRLSRLYNRWREDLKKALAHVEADIEFPDEDLPDEISPAVLQSVSVFHNEISDHLNDNRRGERLRDGLSIVIIGAPNAGKSSLINALAKRDVAIVSDLAGTTRDIIEIQMDLSGYPVSIADTAGLRPEDMYETGHDKIESEGIRRALKKAEHADLKILLFDSAAPVFDAQSYGLKDKSALLVLNKIDQPLSPAMLGAQDKYEIIWDSKLSVIEENGLSNLLDSILQRIESLIGKREAPSLTRQRHRDHLTHCVAHLTRALDASLPEMAAEDLRMAVRDLGRITGRVDVEEMLDVIFRDFCIGK